MVEVSQNLFVGTAQEYEDKISKEENWAVIHACKEPYHRQLLGYKERGAPKDHKEYLFAVRDSRLYLNMIDADNAKYIPKSLIDRALDFIEVELAKGQKIFVHCNKGESRAPTLALLSMAKSGKTSADLKESLHSFKSVYPNYKPASGMSDFLTQNWKEYRG